MQLKLSFATRVCKLSSMWGCSHYWGIIILPFHSSSFHWTWKHMCFYSYISEKQEGGFINVIVHRIGCYWWHVIGFPGGSDGKESVYSVGDLSLIPGLGRSRGGHGNPFQYSQPGESPWTEEAGGLQSMASQRVGHNWLSTMTFYGEKCFQVQFFSFNILNFYLPFLRAWTGKDELLSFLFPSLYFPLDSTPPLKKKKKKDCYLNYSLNLNNLNNQLP